MQSILRRLYYALPPGGRHLVRWLAYAPSDMITWITGRTDPLVPPRRLQYTGGGDFRKLGQTHLTRMRKYTHITPRSHVLDIGSGIGRMAVALTTFLDRNGRYNGFDVVRTGVRWCQRHITTRYPNFVFSYQPLRNALYRASGKDAATFTFPYADHRFDLVILTSVFTHMLPAAMERYFREIHRVLASDGQVYVSLFVYNPEVLAAMESGVGFNFSYDFGHYRLLSKRVPQANVAYEEGYLEDLCHQQGFIIEKKIAGFWSSAADRGDNDFQDIWVLKRTDRSMS